MIITMIEYAHKVSKLEVGKWYLVAHAEMKNRITGHVWDWIPVIPIQHKDDFAPHIDSHYHLDMRFRCNDAINYKYSIKDGKTGRPVIVNDTYDFAVSRIVFKRKKCIRLDTGLNTYGVVKEHPFFKWMDSMKGKSCKGRKCPHFGATMSEINGQLVCPMHGLIGNIQTEKII